MPFRNSADDQARRVWPPEPGYFRLRLVKGGWPVGARIGKTEDGLWQAEVDGKLHHPNWNPAYARMVSDIWHYGERIDQATYQRLIDQAAHARAHDPGHPAADPYTPIDRAKLKPIQPKIRTPNT
jgi:hypothetical protein